MRSFALKTHLLLALALMTALSGGAGLAYFIRTRAHARIEAGFHSDLERLNKLTHLQIALWRLDLAADRFILSGRPASLSEYRAVLEVLKTLRTEIDEQSGHSDESPLISDLDAALDSYLAGNDRILRQKQTGGIAPGEAALMLERKGSEAKTIEAILAIRDHNRDQLRESRLAEGRASAVTFLLVLSTAVASSLLLLVILLRNIIRPTFELERAARAWRLGEPWSHAPGPASPEIASLSGAMKTMAERLNAQFQAEHKANELKGQLVALVSHDFNNALAVIHGVTTILEETGETASRERHDELYRILKSNVRSLSLECSTILNMGRLESGHFAVSPAKTTLRTILQESVERLDILAQRKGQHVLLELPEVHVPVKADPEALSLVITNLLSNAIKYTPNGGTIRLGLRGPQDAPRSMEVYVEDTGIGIKPEEKQKIFSGYYRTEGGKTVARGFGIGLSLAKNIVEAHGSALGLVSEPGKGSRFFFRLPVWEDKADA